MAQRDVPEASAVAAAPRKRSHESPAASSAGNDNSSSNGSSYSSTSDRDTSTARQRRKDRRRRQNNSSSHSHHHQHKRPNVNGRGSSAAAPSDLNGSSRAASGNANGAAFQQRRDSLGKAARDPRDQAPVRRRAVVAGQGQRVRPPSPVIDDDGLSRPGRGTRQRRLEDEPEAEQRLERMRGAVRTLLECVGEDPDREGLLDTPSRYAKALLFLTGGYQVNVEDLVNNALFHEGHNEMVIVKDIEIHSLCEHHLVPFTGKMHIGYIPSDTVIGLSKLPRIAEMYARRLQIQERLTKEVAHAIMEILKPQGVAVVMESSHLCMVMRGVQQRSSSTITSCVLGCFERKSKTRNEFLSLVGINRS
ncbi:hypothetical protein HIM_06096 [Hirsutella minnesotensis 3608]|uniref:GTP cyclohydrolase 1 n=1 Tax=Hirsutella minnesotensis 3608 TaxID=1043627 RepID=A0A0F7ZNX3_9HYPO|nr:hypothetical protein HIM_06096 [Hirsutella minnesotensis 3608]